MLKSVHLKRAAQNFEQPLSNCCLKPIINNPDSDQDETRISWPNL